MKEGRMEAGFLRDCRISEKSLGIAVGGKTHA